ncbi:hypothetical protein HIM_02903 [Hirsutella minnesotensis 3608]|nr:hypothetical protein HIM_02903 [Hirsutella minnesotensis 3608]
MKIATIAGSLIGLATIAEGLFTGEDYNAQLEKLRVILNTTNREQTRPLEGCSIKLPFDERFSPKACRPRDENWMKDVKAELSKVKTRFDEFQRYWDGLGQIGTWLTLGAVAKPDTIEVWAPFMELVCCEDPKGANPPPSPPLTVQELGDLASNKEALPPAAKNPTFEEKKLDEPEPVEWECGCADQGEQKTKDPAQDAKERVEGEGNGKVLEALPEGCIVEAAQGKIWVPGMVAQVGAGVALFKTASATWLAMLATNLPDQGSQQKPSAILEGIEVEADPSSAGETATDKNQPIQGPPSALPQPPAASPETSPAPRPETSSQTIPPAPLSPDEEKKERDALAQLHTAPHYLPGGPIDVPCDEKTLMCAGNRRPSVVLRELISCITKKGVGAWLRESGICNPKYGKVQ